MPPAVHVVAEYTAYDHGSAPQFKLMVPEGGRFLDLQMVDGVPKMWFLVNPNKNRKQRVFVIVKSGVEIPVPISTLEYTATFTSYHFVYHVFEVL